MSSNMDETDSNSISQGNPITVWDESHYNIRHENNRIFIHVIKEESRFYNEIRSYHQIPTDQVRIRFRLDHQLVPHDLPRILYRDGFKVLTADHEFTQPFHVFNSEEQARPAFHAMLSSFQVPFEYRPEFGELHWGFWNGPGHDPIEGFDGVVDRLSKAGVRIVGEALASRDAEPIGIIVLVLKRTIVDAELYRAMLAHYENELLENNEDDDQSFDNGEGFAAAKVMLETVTYDGDDGDLECSICLDEVLIGSQVSRCPCSLRFHELCIVTWLNKSQTCPLCRFILVKKDF